MTSFSSVSIFESGVQEEVSHKTRKIDNEGFVTPATPDIPKSSVQYEDHNIDGYDGYVGTAEGDMYIPPEDGSGDNYSHIQHLGEHESDQQNYGQIQDSGAFQMDDSPAIINEEGENQGSIPFTSDQNECESTRPIILDETENDPSASVSELPPVEQRINDLSQDLKMNQLKWALDFKNCEDFELLCPKRVDQILAAAKQYERSLLKQKEEFLSRLNMLSNTLHLNQ